MNNEKYICKNCGSEFTLNYCNNCGQKKIEKYNLKVLTSKLYEIVEFETGFLITFYRLFRYPKIFFDELLNGKTRPYTNPILFMITIMVIISIFLHIKFKYILHSDRDLTNLVFYIYFIPYIIYLTILMKVFYFKYYRELFNYLVISIYLISVFMLFFIQFVTGKLLDSYFELNIFENILKYITLFLIPYFIFKIFYQKGKLLLHIIKSILIGLLFTIGFDKITALVDNSQFIQNLFK